MERVAYVFGALAVTGVAASATTGRPWLEAAGVVAAMFGCAAWFGQIRDELRVVERWLELQRIVGGDFRSSGRPRTRRRDLYAVEEDAGA